MDHAPLPITLYMYVLYVHICTYVHIQVMLVLFALGWSLQVPVQKCMPVLCVMCMSTSNCWALTSQWYTSNDTYVHTHVRMYIRT